jgi:tRNA1(Val) A37 N6-methylase TrmN6
MRLSELPKERLEDLYVNLLRTDKEIASIFGVTEDAVRSRRGIYNIPTIDPWERKRKRSTMENIVVTIEGAEKSRHSEITKEMLEDLYIKQGKPDIEIGKILGMSDVAIGCKRRKFGIETVDRNATKKETIKNLPNTDLKNIYYNNINKDIDKKFGVSKTIWYQEVKERGIETKNENRINSYPPLTEKQIQLIIGGLLGDGGIDVYNRYYESHAINQTMYLKYKHEILKPYSLDVYKCTGEKDTGYMFSTCCHPNIKVFRDLFYKERVEGKLIPLDYIKEHWCDDILAYWFFDDGHFMEGGGTFSVANGCKVPGQLEALVEFMNIYYNCVFKVTPGDSVFSVQIPNDFKGKFVNILLKLATPDLYYKIPEGHLTPEMIKNIDFSISEIKPKFVRLMGEQQKNSTKDILFNKLNGSPFPYSNYTEDKLKEFLNKIAESSGSLQGKIIKVTNSGTAFCEYFFPNFWDCYRYKTKSPVVLWKDSEAIKLLIEAACLKDSFSLSTFRSVLKYKAVSLFKPAVAKFIYDRFSPSNSVVYDFSSGFGGRLTGFFCSKNCSEYIGIEPNPETYENLSKLTQYLKNNIGDKKVSIYKQGSEDFCPDDLIEKIDIAFSSPPYFDLECYGSDPNQSIVKYPRYEDWIKEYLDKTITNCCKMLKKGGYLIICLNNYHSLNQNLLKICFSRGFKLTQKLFSLSLSRGLMHGGETRRMYSDPIYVFEKITNPTVVNYVTISEDTIENASTEKDEKVIIKRTPKVYIDFDIVIEKFKEVAPIRGLSREKYDDPNILGADGNQIEYQFNGWNAFLDKCGFKPQHVEQDKKEIIRDYFNECIKNNEALTFYKYGMSRIGFLEGKEGRKLGSKYTLRMKRIFDTGKPYHHLLEELKLVALKPECWDEFLKKFD